MLIGYARVSTGEQNLDLQIDALTKAGCEKIITDKISSTKNKRKGLDKLNEILREGDTLIIWRLDRLFGGLVQQLIGMLELEKKGIKLQSLNEKIDTETPAGKLHLQMMGVWNEYRLSFIRHNANAGLAAARARGIVGGRKNKLNEKQIRQLKELYAQQVISIKEIAEIMGIHRSTLYNYINKEKNKGAKK